MAKNIFPKDHQTFRTCGYRSIRIYTKFERKSDQKLTFFFHTYHFFVYQKKLLVGESSVKISVCQIILSHALAFKYYLIMSKMVSLKFGQVKSIKTLPFITLQTWPVFAIICQLLLGIDRQLGPTRPTIPDMVWLSLVAPKGVTKII